MLLVLGALLAVVAIERKALALVAVWCCWKGGNRVGCTVGVGGDGVGCAVSVVG